MPWSEPTIWSKNEKIFSYKGRSGQTGHGRKCGSKSIDDRIAAGGARHELHENTTRGLRCIASGNLYLSLIQVQDQTMAGHCLYHASKNHVGVIRIPQSKMRSKMKTMIRTVCLRQISFHRRRQASDFGTYWNEAFKFMSTVYIMRSNSLV